MGRVGTETTLCLALVSAALLAATPGIGEVEGNLLQNPGFEIEDAEVRGFPQEWFYFKTGKKNTIEMTDSQAMEGAKSIKLTVQDIPGAACGVAQKVPVEAGATYDFELYVRNDKDDRLAHPAYALLGIEWRDAEGNEISRDTGDPWNQSLSRMRWTRFHVKAKAPDRAAEAHFALYFYDGDPSGKGSFYIDAAAVTK